MSDWTESLEEFYKLQVWRARLEGRNPDEFVAEVRNCTRRGCQVWTHTEKPEPFAPQPQCAKHKRPLKLIGEVYRRGDIFFRTYEKSL